VSQILKLGTRSYRALDGSNYQESVSIEAETEKAILVRIGRGGKVRMAWLPRSQIQLIKDRVIVPDWLWEKKQA
jgi:predicted regulator of Ras-like GTPase activity (Roadblock/LC7/MglB family)